MRKLGAAQKAELDTIQEKLLQLESISAEIEEMVENYKTRIIEIYREYEFPEKTDKSQVYGNIRVTQPEAAPFVDFKEFIDTFGFDVFLETWDITKAELNVEKWNVKVNDEAVTESDLFPLIKYKDIPKPRITLVKAKKAK